MTPSQGKLWGVLSSFQVRSTVAFHLPTELEERWIPRFHLLFISGFPPLEGDMHIAGGDALWGYLFEVCSLTKRL